MDDCKNYGRYGSKPECPKCELQNYCKEAKNPSPLNSCEYDDARSNSITDKEAKEAAPERDEYYLSPSDIRQILFSLLSVMQESKTRFKILTCWLTEFGGTTGKGRDSLVKNIAKSTGYSPRTCMRHIQRISDHKTLGKVFVYHNKRVGNRKIDMGSSKSEIIRKSWMQMEMLLK